MKSIALALTALVASSCGGAPRDASPPTGQTSSEPPTGDELAHRFVIYDGHIDLPYRLKNLRDEGKPAPDLSAEDSEGQFDAVRAKAGGLDAPFMSIYIPAELQVSGGAKALADELIDSVEDIVRKWPSEFALAKTPSQVRTNFASGKVSLLMGIENGAALEGDIANVQHFFDRGVRYITLTHSKVNRICDSSYDEERKWNGLSPFGYEVVAEMNRLGILVDISHVSDETFYDVMKATTKPVIASHSSLRHFTPGFERNMSDDMVRALADNGGVVMINFGSTFISQTSIEWRGKREAAIAAYKAEHPEADEAAIEAFGDTWVAEHPFPYASVSDVADHIDRVVQLVGVSHVGFGSDFDGVGDSLPVGLKDASDYPSLIDELLSRGYTAEDIGKMASGNLERVWLAQANSQ